LAGAWLLNQFAGFRLVVFYVAQVPSAEARQAMGFHEEQKGENVWLVVPNDEGVFDGASERAGIRCVHPVQVYLDLKDQPERSTKAAEQLRAKLLRKDGHVFATDPYCSFESAANTVGQWNRQERLLNLIQGMTPASTLVRTHGSEYPSLSATSSIVNNLSLSDNS